MKNNKDALLLFIWAFFVLVASLLPPSAIPKVGWESVISLDKIAHFGIYLILSLFVVNWLHSKNQKSKWAIAIVSSSIYGFLMEVLQHFIYTGRNFEFLDIIANIIGSIAGVAIFNFILNSRLWKD